MTINERIRYLRKEVLKLNQTDFAKAIGMKQTGLSYIEKNNATVKKQVAKTICMVFHLNEDWLLNGNEPMFVQPDTFSLDEFIRQHGGTELELNIVKTYFELDPDLRKTILQHFKTRLFSIRPEQERPADSQEPSEKDWSHMTVEEAEAEYIKSRSKHAQKKDSSVSNTTADRKIVNQ